MSIKMEENYELAKWLAGEMTESELVAFQKTPEYTTYTKIAAYSADLEVPEFNSTILHQNIISKLNKKGKRKIITLPQNWWFKIAALFLVFLGLSVGYKSMIAVSEYAENGQQTNFVLPDNSKVVLNAGSEIEYSKWNWKNHRQLNLTGEAYFRVAKGKQFEVCTDLGKVIVMGTQFDVKARNKRFDVVCYEGRVKVNYQGKEVIITKGKRVAFEDGNAIEISDHTATEPEWINGVLAFTDENIEHIVKELERQYNISITLQKPTDFELFTGKIPIDNLQDALAIIAATYHLKVTKLDDQKIQLEALNGNR